MPNMFENEGGREARILALCEQEIVCGDRVIAERLADLVVIEEAKPGELVIRQDERSSHMYFILSGTISVLFNHRQITTRERKHTVGEMALIDPGANRSATCVAVDDCILARIEQADFIPLADANTGLWRGLARALANRLRQRNARERFRNERPHIFLGSSSESAPVLAELEMHLDKAAMKIRSWNYGDLFRPSASTIETLEKAAFECDFAALVFGPDDRVFSRWSLRKAPRDNVVFELGLFMGAMGRDRTIVIDPERPRLKIPSDLHGVTTMRYANLAAFSNLSGQLNRLVKEGGPL